MFSLRPFIPGHQAADAADDQVDLHAGLRRRVEGVDRRLVDQGVHLGEDPGRLAVPRVGGLAVDQLADAAMEVERGDQQVAEPLRPPEPGQRVEELGDVAR
jgi:hypothetical protein